MSAPITGEEPNPESAELPGSGATFLDAAPIIRRSCATVGPPGWLTGWGLGSSTKGATL